MYALSYRTIEGSAYVEEEVLYDTLAQAAGYARMYARKFGRVFSIVKVEKCNVCDECGVIPAEGACWCDEVGKHLI